MTVTPASALSTLPKGLRDDLLGAFQQIVTNYAEHRWEPAELNGGKLCEAVYSVVRGIADNSFPDRAKKPRNILDACKAMEKEKAVPRSVSIQIPRMLVALYEIRNNRGVGHAGSAVDPNPMDATAVLYMSKWLLAEVIRIVHTLTADEAAALVESLMTRETPLIWTGDGKRRILTTDLTRKQQVLILLASSVGAVKQSEMMEWLECPVKGQAAVRRDVLRPLHKARLIEFDEQVGTLTLLPPGVAEADAVFRAHSGVPT